MNKTIYALGFFDGVHLGHQALLHVCRNLAEHAGTNAGAVTFASHPDTLVLGSTPGLITTHTERTRLLIEDYGMDSVVTLPFDKKMRETTWEDFLSNLINRENAAGFVCGEDFRFGQQGLGNSALLTAFCRSRNLPSAVVPDQLLNGIRISSTAIRKMLQSGDVSGAAAFLGRPYQVRGQVYRGCMPLSEELEVPLPGRYVARISGQNVFVSLSRNVETGRALLQIQDFPPELQNITVELLSPLQKTSV